MKALPAIEDAGPRHVLPIDEDDFRLWLASKDPQEIVGWSFDSDGCPVARFLREIGGHRLVEVGSSSVCIGRFLVFRTPGWASRIVKGVDYPSLDGRRPVSATSPVFAKEVLAILDRVEAS